MSRVQDLVLRDLSTLVVKDRCDFQDNLLSLLILGLSVD